MKRQPFASCCILLCLACLLTLPGHAQQVQSPNHRIKVSLSERVDRKGSWFLSVQYANPVPVTPFPAINLGIERNDQAFVESLSLKKVTKAVPIHERYTALHGKRSLRMNEAMEITADFINDKGSPMQVVIRAYDDGIAFRYGFPSKGTGSFTVQNEQTSFQVAPTADRWLQQFVTSYEGFYEKQTDSVSRGEWGFPALFGWRGDNPCWALVTEADVNQTYCTSKLTNQKQADLYALAFPAPTDGNGTGAVNPTITLPWVSPWRVAIIGQLSDIAQSTLVEDVSSPTKLTNLDWVKPGIASWVYWGYNHGTKDYKKLCSYIDLAARMGWPYTLIDWEWDEMENGGKLEDAVAYARSKGVKPLLWYNSGGAHNRVSSGPRDRLSTPESRAKEFAWLKKIGIYGIKVDFFESDKQDMITYYLDILKEAANYQLLVNFHGSTVPRGWSRTYPHLISMEAVYGAEQYNNGSAMTEKAAWHNSMLPFTRNVIGPMDYTPIAFTNSQHVHTTSFAHELALAIVFESGIQHLADRPSGFDNLPDPAKSFLKTVPTTWDETRLLGGYPGQEVIMARRKGSTWYVGGINGEQKEKKLSVPLSFLPRDKAYRTEIIADGEHNMAFDTSYRVVSASDSLTIPCLRRGGFSIIMKEL